MNEVRTTDQVSRDIERQRTELAAAIAAVRHDLRGIAIEQIPRIGVAVGFVLAAVVSRSLVRRHRHSAPVERFRFGRFALIERG